MDENYEVDIADAGASQTVSVEAHPKRWLYYD